MYKTPFGKSRFSSDSHTKKRRPFKAPIQKGRDTSWQNEAKSYNKAVGEEGHYYHQHSVIPGVIKLLNLKKGDSVLDLGCGQGVLARAIPSDISYTGIDNSNDLVKMAQKMDNNSLHEYITASATKQLKLSKQFSHATIVLALQNMELPEIAIENASNLLKKQGKLVIVLNHPHFRIPRQSGWGEHANKIQYRYVNRYLTPMQIPILMHPSQKSSSTTMSFHFPLSSYTKWFQKHGFLIETIEEWTSDKVSEGKAARSENRARSEFPLFMAIKCVKN